MIKRTLFLATSLLLTSTISSANIDDIKKLPIFDSPNLEINDYKENISTYQVKGVIRGERTTLFEAFITKDYKEVIFGKGFDAITQRPISIPLDVEYMKSIASYSIGEGKEEYFIFTDPECPYCKNLEKLMPQLGKNAKFHIFLFPLSFHKNAKAMSYSILSQDDNASRAKTMHDIANGSDNYKNVKLSQNQVEQFEASLKLQINFAEKIGVNGTPTIFDAIGNKVEYPDLLKKYSTKEPVDMGGIEFLKKGDLDISLSSVENNETIKKEPIYVFTTIEKLKKLKQIEQKYQDNKSIYVFLKLDKMIQDLDSLKAIYMQKKDKRVELLRKLMNGETIDSNIIADAKNIDKSEETKFLPVSYVMQKMHLDVNSDFLIIDSNGNVQSDIDEQKI